MRPDDYLVIPEAYGRWLGGLRWGEDGDVIEYSADDPEIGLTFAMSAEVALFLDGATAGHRPPHFAFVLHLLHLMGFGGRHAASGTSTRVPVHEDLSRAFRETGRSLRNAGVLCNVLCRDVPGIAESPDPKAISRRLLLRRQGNFVDLRRSPGEEPPLGPTEFDARIRQTLRAWSIDDLRHWLRHGRGPVPGAGDAVARVVPVPLAQALAEVEARPRLSGMAGLVPHLNGALTLPPRSLAHADLPLGGYTDVTNRGQPEQILPSQLALDPDEFLRRFASRELLYYHREEPHAPTARELVLVIDQGVRTWGDVRLVLAAAAVALVRQADRKKLAIRLATTGNGGNAVELAGLDAEALGQLLESSDLTPNPAPALARAIASRTEPRDLILLTHPRNLAEPEVTAAAADVETDDRLFAVSVNPSGEVALSEIHPSGPIPIGRCRVDPKDLHAGEEPAPAPSVTNDPPSWRGDVESVGFPFAIGALAPFSDAHYAFDESGYRLLLAGRRGLLHAWRTDGSASEMLPRATWQGQVLENVSAVIGVAGGFVVAGTVGDVTILAHYDWQARSCNVHGVDAISGVPLHWTYLRQFHTVLGEHNWKVDHVIDLGAKNPRIEQRTGISSSSRSTLATGRSQQDTLLLGTTRPGFRPSWRGPLIKLSEDTGEIMLREEMNGAEHRHIPLSEGRPRLVGGKMIYAYWRAGTLALLLEFRDGRRSIFLFEAPGSWRFLSEHLCPRDLSEFAISPDGRRIAWRINERQLVARVVGEAGPPSLMTPKGRTHPGLGLALGRGFLTIHAGRHSHLVRWDRGRLEFVRSNADVDSMVQWTFGVPVLRVTAVGPPAGHIVPSDRRRFSKYAVMSNLIAAVDQFGQVVILDRAGNVVCMFLVFRDQIAAWAPDGSRFGPVPMLGRPPTPGAEERIAAALVKAAEDWGVPAT